MPTTPHLDRMIPEHEELRSKINRLEEFRATPPYQSLPLEEQERLTSQLMFMRGYGTVLQQRIDYARRSQ